MAAGAGGWITVRDAASGSFGTNVVAERHREVALLLHLEGSGFGVLTFMGAILFRAPLDFKRLNSG